MRRERKPSPLRGLMLFLLGALVGANAVYFVMTRDRAPAAAAPTAPAVQAAPPGFAAWLRASGAVQSVPGALRQN